MEEVEVIGGDSSHSMRLEIFGFLVTRNLIRVIKVK